MLLTEETFPQILQVSHNLRLISALLLCFAATTKDPAHDLSSSRRDRTAPRQ